MRTGGGGGGGGGHLYHGPVAKSLYKPGTGTVDHKGLQVNKKKAEVIPEPVTTRSKGRFIKEHLSNPLQQQQPIPTLYDRYQASKSGGKNRRATSKQRPMYGVSICDAYEGSAAAAQQNDAFSYGLFLSGPTIPGATPPVPKHKLDPLINIKPESRCLVYLCYVLTLLYICKGRGTRNTLQIRTSGVHLPESQLFSARGKFVAKSLYKPGTGTVDHKGLQVNKKKAEVIPEPVQTRSKGRFIKEHLSNPLQQPIPRQISISPDYLQIVDPETEITKNNDALSDLWKLGFRATPFSHVFQPVTKTQKTILGDPKHKLDPLINIKPESRCLVYLCYVLTLLYICKGRGTRNTL
eukprot:sb/3466206/